MPFISVFNYHKKLLYKTTYALLWEIELLNYKVLLELALIFPPTSYDVFVCRMNALALEAIHNMPKKKKKKRKHIAWQ